MFTEQFKKEQVASRGIAAWLAVAGLALVWWLTPPGLADGRVVSEYQNPWYPRSTAETAGAMVPHATLFYGGSDPGPADDGQSDERSAPTNHTANLRIAASQFGMPIGGLEASYSFGQQLPPPHGADLSQSPIIETLGGDPAAVWLDYAQALYAVDRGAVRVTWHMRGTTNLYSVPYTISDAPDRRPVRLFWTESPYNAPAVQLPSAPIRPTVHYNNQIAGTNQVWMDAGNTLHAAADARGQFLLTFSSKDDQGHEHLQAVEIVHVLEPTVTEQSVAIGDRLLPVSAAEYGTDKLFTRVVRGLGDQSQEEQNKFIYQHAGGRQNGWLYAIRKTEAPWQVEVYWMARSELDVIWPFEMDHYSLDWSPEAQRYVRGDPDTGGLGPDQHFAETLGVALMSYQVPAGHAALEGRTFRTTQTGQCLLKYTVDDEVWFEAIRSVWNTDDAEFDLDAWYWDIGDELMPRVVQPHSALAFAGGFADIPAATCPTPEQALAIEAWIQPQGTGWRTVLMKGDYGYGLSLDDGQFLRFWVDDQASNTIASTQAVPTNQWSHVAVVVQHGPPGVVQFYLDGQPAGTFSADLVAIRDGQGGHLVLGAKGSALTDKFDGEIDEVRLWSYALPGGTLGDWMNRELTQEHPFHAHLFGHFKFDEAEGWQIRNSAQPEAVAGELRGNLDWAASGATLRATPEVESEYRNWPGFIRSEAGDGYNPHLYHYPTNATTVPPLSQVFAVNTGSLEVWWANRSRLTDLPVPVYWPSLVNAYTNVWPVEPGQIVIASELGNESAALETATSGCLLLNGTNAHLSVVDAPSLRLRDNYTLEGWVYPTATNAPLTILSKGDDVFTLQVRDGRLAFYDDASRLWRFSTSTVPANQWTHVAVTVARGPAGIRFYVAGSPAGEADGPLPADPLFVADGSLTPWPVNAHLLGDATRPNGEDTIILTPNQPSQKGSLLFDSPSSSQGATEFVATWDYRLTVGSPKTGADGYSFCYSDLPNEAFGESGSGSGLQVRFLTWNNNGPDRVELYLRGQVIAQDISPQPFGSWTPVQVQVRPKSENSSEREARVEYANGRTLGWITLTNWNPLSTWRFGFGARNGGAWQLNEVRAVRVATGPAAAPTGPLAIGKRAPGYRDNEFFAGKIDEVRLWGAARTARQIKDNLYVWVSRDDPDLRAYYYFDAEESKATVFTDWSGYANLAVSHGAEHLVPGVPWLNPGRSFQDRDPVVYYQNDPALPGYNPNEEHALVQGETVFALRDDLNDGGASEPYVLVEYADIGNASRPAMAVFQVVETNALYSFGRETVAGSMIQPPLPISRMFPPNCNENYFDNATSADPPAWRDRKQAIWAHRAGHDGGMSAITMRFYYPVQESFAFRSADRSTWPRVGQHIPWLPNAGGNPIAFTYGVSWPDDPPVLNTVSTLVEARDGLPAIRGQQSVAVLYQQSQHDSQNAPSVVLLDPTQARAAQLDAVPSAMHTYVDPATGLTHFADLPPDLRSRLYYDPTAAPDQKLRLVGEYVELTDARYNYLRLNLLTDAERQLLSSLSGANEAWTEAVNALPETPIVLPDDETRFDSLALSAGAARGTGYVTLAFNDSSNTDMVDPGLPIDLKVIRVDNPKCVGNLDLILSDNPLDERLNLRYTADFAGQPEDFEFEWQHAPGTAPDNWARLDLAAGRDRMTIGESGIFGLADHWIRCRYRALDTNVQQVIGTDWSEWTDPALAESWIKRVMKAITPYEQRIKDFQAGLLTTLDMIAQAGPPYRGDVPLNLDALNRNGLMALYQTILEKGKKLSIYDGYNDRDVNLALLLAAGRLSDLYLLLGNEAYADALDPTIGIGTSSESYGEDAPAIFCFMNQLPTLLDETLALLRGRDDSLNPPLDTYPVYNRLFWNFTKDIAGGEVAYALNYDIRDASGQLDGRINEADAMALYPQGHGDAWGHDLSAIKGYYLLLANPHFTWIPQAEAINVGDEPVSVSFLHEQRLCQSAVAKARAGERIVSDTYRALYPIDPDEAWTVMRDSDTDRQWGLAEWASRAGQGAYVDWVVANALLPNHDSVPDHSGIELIDRQTVPELPEITAHYQRIQQRIDEADGGLNPLGLVGHAVPFDISPADIDAGQTHFEQVYEKALAASRNALAIFDRVRANSQALRDQSQSQAESLLAIRQAEMDYTNRLVEVYGYPYSDDIGTGKVYPQGYQGPDLIHHNYVDIPDLIGMTDTGREIAIDLEESTYSEDGGRHLTKTTNSVTFYVSDSGLPSKPPTYAGKRRAEGRIQIALMGFVRAVADLKGGLAEYEHLQHEIETQLDILDAKIAEQGSVSGTLSRLRDSIHDRNGKIHDQHKQALRMHASAEGMDKWFEAFAEYLPDSMEGWTYSIIKGLLRTAGMVFWTAFEASAVEYEIDILEKEHSNEDDRMQAELDVATAEYGYEVTEQTEELKLLIRSQTTKEAEIQSLIHAAEEARMEHVSALAEGQRLQMDWRTFRVQTAGTLNADRYRNMAFRIFRNDALSKYQAAFDLAARYTYLAARAYDYETALDQGQAGAVQGSDLFRQIVRAQALGRFSIPDKTYEKPEPLPGGPAGDPGLADVLARLKANWGVLKGRYGFNNPQTETSRFSFRTELFRIAPGEAGDAAWRTELGKSKYYVSSLADLPEFRRYCLPFDPLRANEPALVIPFTTSIRFGQNFFGRDLAAGDNAYDSSYFATKIRGVGVWFSKFNNVFGTGLANQPRVYLIPVGLDLMRAPSDQSDRIRSWTVFDQALPVPYTFQVSDLENPNWVPLQDSLGGEFARLRKYPALRAYHDAGFDLSEIVINSRLVGRSVWNSQWLLIIPGGTLLKEGKEGLERFINGNETAPGVRDGNGVKDILLHFQTYAYAGN